MFCKVLTHGDFILSKKDFITDTRRPGVCESDFCNTWEGREYHCLHDSTHSIFSYFDVDTNKQERMVTLRQILRDPQLLTLRQDDFSEKTRK